MLHRHKSLSSHLSAYYVLQIRQLRTKPNKQYNKYANRFNGSDEDAGVDRVRKQKENLEVHLRLHKSRGQHLLTNPRVLDSIVSHSDVKPTDTVLEIGPGTGNLTLRLLEVARKVVAVEVDKRMVEVLENRVLESGFEEKLSASFRLLINCLMKCPKQCCELAKVIYKDALKTEFPNFDLVVANIPYNISSPLVAKLLFGPYQFRSATLLLQKEFARRLLANPGESDFNRLAVNVKLVAEVEHVMNVSKKDFLPCPKVDSSVIKIHPRADVPDVNLDEWLAFTRTCFSKKNKTLGATFKQKRKVMELLKLSELEGSENTFGYNTYNSSDDEDGGEWKSTGKEVSAFKDRLVGTLKAAGFEDKRPSKLSIEELMCSLSLFNQDGIHFCCQGITSHYRENY